MEGLYYICSENKGADQLRSFCAADLRLCFRIYKKPVFSQRGSNEREWGPKICMKRTLKTDQTGLTHFAFAGATLCFCWICYFIMALPAPSNMKRRAYVSSKD